jgi:hypothetical protein
LLLSYTQESFSWYKRAKNLLSNRFVLVRELRIPLKENMRWFQGSIPEAIIASRNKKSIFVVVVTAEDDDSQQLLVRLEDENVSSVFNNFVSISLKNGTE